MSGSQHTTFDLSRAFRAHLRRNGLIAPGERVLVAYSGGPDSSALLYLLCDVAAELRLSVAAAHLHHGLRGAEADADLEHCRAAARDLGVPLFDGRVTIEREGQSMQGAARRERERFLVQTAQAQGYGKVATAHTADDVVETLVFRLARGTGVHGLAGIPAARGPFVRPLLQFRRAELLEYLAQRGCAFRQDSSNGNLHYARNRVRHNVLPLLRDQFGPGLEASLLRLARFAALDDQALAQWADQAAAELLSEERPGCVTVDQAGLIELPAAVRLRVIERALGRVGRFEINSRHLEACDRLLSTGQGEARISLPGGLQARRVGTLAWINQAGTDQPLPRFFEPVPLIAPGITLLPMGWGSVEASDRPIDRDEQALALDPLRLVGSLAARPYRFGDRYQPLGRPAEIKLKSLFERLGRSIEQRRRCVLLQDDAGLVGGAGLPPAARAALAPEQTAGLWVRFR